MIANAIPAELYQPLPVEAYQVGERTLWRVAGLQVSRRGRCRSMECSIAPADYPQPTHERRRVIVACGMGVDSVAMLIEMHRRGIRPDLILWADTGSERRHTYRYLNVLQAWLRSVGFPPVCVVRRVCPEAGHRSLYEENWNLETLPSATYSKNHSCSIKWKLNPQREYQKQLPWLWAAPMREALGFEADESESRKGLQDGRIRETIGIEADEAGKRRSVSSRYQVDNDTDYQQWYPLIDWGMTRRDCVDLIVDQGLPLPGKSACFHCPVSKLCELQAMADEDPETLGAATDLEDRYQAGRHYAKGVADHEAGRTKRIVQGLAMGKKTWSEWMATADDVAPEAAVGLAADPLADPEVLTVDDAGEPAEAVQLALF